MQHVGNEIRRGCLDSLRPCKEHDKHIVNYVVVLLPVNCVLDKDANHVEGVIFFNLLLLSFDNETFNESPQCLAINEEALVNFCYLSLE